MGYLQQGKEGAYFIRMTDDIDKEFYRLVSIGRRTNKKRVKRKIAKRIDALIPVADKQ